MSQELSARPFAEGQVGGDDHRGLFVELADVEVELGDVLGERQLGESYCLGESSSAVAAEIADDLEAALEQFGKIAAMMSGSINPAAKVVVTTIQRLFHAQGLGNGRRLSAIGY